MKNCCFWALATKTRGLARASRLSFQKKGGGRRDNNTKGICGSGSNGRRKITVNEDKKRWEIVSSVLQEGKKRALKIWKVPYWVREVKIGFSFHKGNEQ